MPIIPDEAWPAWFNPEVIPDGLPERIEDAVGALELLLPSLTAAGDQIRSVWVEIDAADLPTAEAREEIDDLIGLEKLRDLMVLLDQLSDLDEMFSGKARHDGHEVD